MITPVVAPKNKVYTPRNAKNVVALAWISQGQIANEITAQMNCPRRMLTYLGNNPVRSLARGTVLPVTFVMILKKMKQAPAKNFARPVVEVVDHRQRIPLDLAVHNR